jgi:outer membrane protein OmpA-like peptidoglycan-associated protein
MNHKTSALLPLLIAVCMAASAADPPPQSPGGVLSDEQIENALKPAKTRGMSMRGLKRTQAAESAAAVNLNIPFEYNSSELKAEASAQLKQLQSALTRESLRNDRFLVAGHTDAKGNPQYNKQLSLKRAESVKRYLVVAGLDAGRLDTVGYGSEQPLAPDRPDDPANRRVEIRDLGEASAKP